MKLGILFLCVPCFEKAERLLGRSIHELAVGVIPHGTRLCDLCQIPVDLSSMEFRFVSIIDLPEGEKIFSKTLDIDKVKE